MGLLANEETKTLSVHLPHALLLHVEVLDAESHQGHAIYYAPRRPDATLTSCGND